MKKMYRQKPIQYAMHRGKARQMLEIYNRHHYKSILQPKSSITEGKASGRIDIPTRGF